MTRVAVTSRSFSRHPILRQELLEHYPETTFNDDGLGLSGDSLIGFLNGHDRAITALERLDGEVFTQLPELKTISKYGVGLDMVDLQAMAAHGVRLGWTGGVNKRSVTEIVLSLAIALLRHLPIATKAVESGNWQQIKGQLLSNRTVGIIGCGHVGKDLAPVLQALQCDVLVHDILDFPEFYAARNIEPVSLEDLLIRSDIVTLHVPLDPSTTNILNRDRLALMKPGAILINAARGNLVDEIALKEMLVSGHLAGAAFDVFAIEPPEDRELISLPNFIATPHIGGSSEEAILAMGRAAISGLENAEVPDSSHPAWR